MNYKLLILFCAILLSFISCNRDEEAIVEKLNPPSVDVYVGGMESGKACFWKNGVLNYLNAGDSISVKKIIVENNIDYAFGTKQSNSYFWKNNVKHELKNYLSLPITSPLYITDFTIKNNSELFAGFTDNSTSNSLSDLCYWKNGVKTILQSNLPYVFGTSVYLYNNDVYCRANTGYYKNTIYFPTVGNGQNFAQTYNELYFLTISSNNQNLNYVKTSTNSNSFTNSVNTNLYPNGSEVKLISDPITNNLYSFGYEYKNIYYKNNTTINFVDPNYKQIQDMKALNDNLYIIRFYKTLTAPSQIDFQYKVFINNVETQYINGTNGTFNSIFVVQN
jgi:hypothetical protein